MSGRLRFWPRVTCAALLGQQVISWLLAFRRAHEKRVENYPPLLCLRIGGHTSKQMVLRERNQAPDGIFVDCGGLPIDKTVQGSLSDDGSQKQVRTQQSKGSGT